MISIEYCHIYTDKGVDELAENSISVLRDVLRDINDIPYELAIMVDDYSPDGNHTFDYNAFVEYLSLKNVTPSLMIMESSLIDANLKLWDSLPEGKLKRSYWDYIRKDKHPCSLFVASWYMMRLEKADRLINILPAYFIKAENRASKVLRALGVPYSLKISNIYIEDNGQHLELI